MMTQATWVGPTPEQLFQTLEITWPSANITQKDGWTIRDGQSGGSRVSAATGLGDIDQAEKAMRDLGQHPLFMVRPSDDDLDAQLAARNYAVFDPVIAYAADVQKLAALDMPELAGIPCDQPLAIQKEIWAQGGIGDPRLAVMARAPNPKSYLIARHLGRPSGTGFIAIHNQIAMLHALEIDPSFRRQGVGKGTTIAAARWALSQGAHTLALVCTVANEGANALYQRLGMRSVTRYHYRKAK